MKKIFNLNIVLVVLLFVFVNTTFAKSNIVESVNLLVDFKEESFISLKYDLLTGKCVEKQVFPTLDDLVQSEQKNPSNQERAFERYATVAFSVRQFVGDYVQLRAVLITDVVPVLSGTYCDVSVHNANMLEPQIFSTQRLFFASNGLPLRILYPYNSLVKDVYIGDASSISLFVGPGELVTSHGTFPFLPELIGTVHRK